MALNKEIFKPIVLVYTILVLAFGSCDSGCNPTTESFDHTTIQDNLTITEENFNNHRLGKNVEDKTPNAELLEPISDKLNIQSEDSTDIDSEKNFEDKNEEDKNEEDKNEEDNEYIAKIKTDCEQKKKLAVREIKSAANLKTRQAYYTAKKEIEKLIKETKKLREEFFSRLKYKISEIQECIDYLNKEVETIRHKLIVHSLKKSKGVYLESKQNKSSLNSAKEDILSLLNGAITLYNEGAYNAQMLKVLHEINTIFIQLKTTDPKKEAYAILGLSNGATTEEIRKVYIQAFSKYHPDKLIGKSKREKEESKEILQKIKEAYDILIPPTPQTY